MNKTRRFSVIILCFSLILAFSACDAGSSGSSDESPYSGSSSESASHSGSSESGEDSSGSSEQPPAVPSEAEDAVDFVLDVEAGRPVRILQLTDIQIIDAAQKRYPDRLTASGDELWATDQMEEVAFKYMRQSVARANPDIIVLTGDNVYGEFDDNGTVLEKLVSEMESYNIPWTATFGNHDLESEKGVAWICEQYMNAPHCMFKRGSKDVEGNCNFTVGIRQGGRLTEILYLLDSHGCAPSNFDKDRDEGIYAREGFMPGQLVWLRKTGDLIKAYNGGTYVKSLGFFHHPVREFGVALNVHHGYTSKQNGFTTPDGVEKAFKDIRIRPNDRGDSGNFHEDPAYIDPDNVFVDLFKSIGGEGLFFGHNHNDNCTVFHEGMRYTFGLKASAYDYHVEIGGTLALADGITPVSVEHLYYDEENK